MAILVIDARESGTSTGRYVDKLIEYLHKLKPGFEIIVLTKSPRLEFMKQIAPSFQTQACDIKEFTFAEQFALKKQLESLKPDLVHFTMTQQPVLYRGKSVTTIHDLTTARFNNPAKNPFVFKTKQIVYREVIRRVARRSAHLITPSAYVKDDVVAFAHVAPSKISVTYEAADKIDTSAKEIKELLGKQFLLFVGRPNPHKNLERLIEAFSLLQKTHPDLRLVLAGKKDVLFNKMEASVQAKGIKNVVFTGFVSEGELRWLYENTAAYVFPSLSEGFGLPGLEAMAHGAPVASSSATCLPEVYDDAAYYFDPSSVEDMTHKIAGVLDNPKLRQELIKRGNAQAAKYSWQATAQQTLEVYKRLLG